MGSPIIFSGNDAKLLKPNLDFFGNVKILSGTVDPSSVATSANEGSLYLNTSNGKTYQKQDNGSTTNWLVLTVFPTTVNNPTYITATSSSFNFSSATNATFAQMTGNKVTLTAGLWTVSGYFTIYTGTAGVANFIAGGSGFFAANGNNTNTTPTALTGTFGITIFANDGTAADVSGSGAVTNAVFQTGTQSFDILVSSTQDVYLVPMVNTGTASNGDFTAFISARLQSALSFAPTLTVGSIDSQTPAANALIISTNSIYAQSASTSNPGMVNNTTQSMSGNKTFTGNLSVTGTSTLSSGAGNVATIGNSTANAIMLGGMTRTTRTITANLTIDTTTNDYFIFCNQSGAINVTLPPPVNGREFVVKDISGTASTNNITLVRNGSEKIEGIAASKVFQTNWGSWKITTNGTDWFIV